MATQSTTLNHRPAKSKRGVVSFVDHPFTISASVRVCAETKRLFQALAVPESLAAWLVAPEDEIEWVVLPLRHGAGFILDWRSVSGVQSSVIAEYRSSTRRKLTLSWKLDNAGSSSESSVTMHLSGDFGYSALSLLHSGFLTFDDFAWHRKLWEVSLERLKAILTEGPLPV